MICAQDQTQENRNAEREHREEDDEALALEDVISRHGRRVLEWTEGNKSETARLLGISRSRFQRYLDKSELEV